MLALPMLEEIKKTIKAINTRKALGLDAIPDEVLFHIKLAQEILHLINN